MNYLIFLCISKLLALIVKLYLCSQTVTAHKNNRGVKTWKLIAASFALAAWGEAVWLLKLGARLANGGNPPENALFCKLILFALGTQWAAAIAEYFLLGLSLEVLVAKIIKPAPRHYIIGTVSATLICAALTITLLNFNAIDAAQRSSSEYMLYVVIQYYTPLSIIPSMFFAYRECQKQTVPKIIAQQVKFLTLYLLLPSTFLFISLLRSLPVAPGDFGVDQYVYLVLNDAVYICALFFCVKRIMKLRFLNTRAHVEAPAGYGFVDDLKSVLLRLSKVITLEELPHVTATFFERTFNLPPESVELHIRSQQVREPERGAAPPMAPDNTLTAGHSAVEQLLMSEAPHDRELVACIGATRVLIRDEITFDYFYDEEEYQKSLLTLLNVLQADIFLPIYERQSLVGYIIVHRQPYDRTLYSNIEQDEMRVFADYLGAIINLLQNRSLTALIHNEKELKDELFTKQQEIQHYKESVRFLLKDTHRLVGLIAVKGKTIAWMSDQARSILGIAPAALEYPAYAHHITQLARDASTYSSERRTTIMGPHNTPLTLAAIPIPGGHTMTMVLVSYQDAAERFTIPFHALKEISSWEYALYLETTQSGQRINQLLPGSGDNLVNFKIDLLKIGLSKKAALLAIPESDTPSIVNLIHTISLRDELVTLALDRRETGNEMGARIFGIEPVFAGETQASATGLLDQLGKHGTLHIHSIEHLGVATQTRLAEWITTGLYQPIYSKRSLSSSARIICSTTLTLDHLLAQKKLSRELFEALREHAVSFPSLTSLSHHELRDLIANITQQSMQHKELRKLIDVGERETQEILEKSPASIAELKHHVLHVLHAKATREGARHLVSLDTPSTEILPASVLEVVRQGKHALKNRSSLTLLWDTFKNQAKIATLLNVNRSSVSRRLREFHIDT